MVIYSKAVSDVLFNDIHKKNYNIRFLIYHFLGMNRLFLLIVFKYDLDSDLESANPAAASIFSSLNSLSSFLSWTDDLFFIIISENPCCNCILMSNTSIIKAFGNY